APGRVDAPPLSGQYDSTASVTSIALFADCPRRYYLSRYLGWNEERRRFEPIEEEETDEAVDASEFGSEVHALLAGGVRVGAQPEGLALVERFESSELGRRLGPAAGVEREFDFLLEIEDVVVRGQIDL